MLLNMLMTHGALMVKGDSRDFVDSQGLNPFLGRWSRSSSSSSSSINVKALGTKSPVRGVNTAFWNDVYQSRELWLAV